MISYFAPDLTHFSLAMTEFSPNDKYLWETLQILAKMKHLTDLELDLSQPGRPKDIKDLFPLFAKLTNLRVRGDWYDGADTLDPFPNGATPWKLKNLYIDSISKSFFPYSQNLERVTLALSLTIYDSTDLSGFKNAIIMQLQQLPRLNTIVIHVMVADGLIQSEFVMRKEDESMWRCSRFPSLPNNYPGLIPLQDLFNLM
jgi:hypothetical protein